MIHSSIRKVKLFVNHNEESLTIADEVRDCLSKHLFEIVEDGFDLGIAIGGDGAFLRMVKQTNFDSNVYYVGIHTGTLGFLQEIQVSEIDSFVDRLQNDNFETEYIGIQETKIVTQDSTSRFFSLNEIVVRDKDLNTIKMDVKIDNILLENFVGDGLLIATSIGSTAYNLSFGGSIVFNMLHTLQITPIAPLNSKSYRSLLNSVIIPENKAITLFPLKTSSCIVTIDGENNIYDHVEEITTIIQGKRIRCIHLNDYDFSIKIHEKFLKD